MEFNLNGKTALITGASRGIGKDISIALSRYGAHVVLSARNREKLAEVKDLITGEGGEVTVIPADLSMEDDVVHLFSEIEKKFKKLDILVNNAGIGYYDELVGFPLEKLDAIYRVNVRGTYQCCQCAMKLMIPRKSGYIINISSMQGIKGYALQSAYAASKHAIVGITKSLGAEAQKHAIRVSVICPGAVDTELIRDARPDLDSSQLIHPEDIARVVLFLLSLSERSMVDMVAIRRRNASPF